MNPWTQVILGVFFLLWGLGYLYRPGLIQRMNAFLREQVLNDARISLERRKWGMFFLLLSLLFIYMGWSALR
ncbi:MAG: hypothetical protein HY748_11385 [Elusimicrobia bacterium]|nr:hypothetical protein [Elusimicrobiota bacterium]